jgi:hypothetical protein
MTNSSISNWKATMNKDEYIEYNNKNQKPKDSEDHKLKKIISKKLLNLMNQNETLNSKDGVEISTRKKNLRLNQLTDKIISVFKKKDKESSRIIEVLPKKKSSIVLVKTKTITSFHAKKNSDIVVVKSKTKITVSNSLDQITNPNLNEETCEICRPSEDSNTKNLTISERLSSLTEEYKHKQHCLHSHISKNSKHIKSGIEKRTRRKVDEYELDEIIDSIMKVETWKKNYCKSSE